MSELTPQVERIAERTFNDWHRLEWAVAYKRQLLERCERQGEAELAASLTREIADLERQIRFHQVAGALVLSALS